MILNGIMNDLVEKYVKHYKTDFKSDIEMLLNKNYKTKHFYWILRECGTNLYEDIESFIQGTFPNHAVKYYLNSESEKAHIFEVIIEKRGRKYFYGEVKELNKKKFLEKLQKEEIPQEKIKEVNVTVETKDGRFINVVLPYSEKNMFYNILKGAKIERGDYKSRYIEYVFI